MKHISALTWFRFEANALSLLEWVRLRWHLLRCARCREQQRQRTALSPAAPTRRRRVVPALALVAVTAVIIVAIRSQTPVDDLQPKGSSQLTLVKVKTEARAFDHRCAPGDQLQAEIHTAHRFALVVLFSESGTQQVLFPPGGAVSGPLTGDRLRMPNSWRIDDAPGAERFIAFFTDAPLEAAKAIDAVRSETPLPGVEIVEQRCVKPRSDGGLR